MVTGRSKKSKGLKGFRACIAGAGALLIVAAVFPVTAPAASGKSAKTQTVTPEQIRGYLQDFLESGKERLPKARIRFSRLRLPDSFEVPAGRLSCRVLPSSPDILSSRRFTLILRVDGRVVKNLAVTGRLDAFAPVVVSAGDLSRGTILGPRDLNVVEMDLNRLREPAFQTEELVGQSLKRSVRLGEPIERWNLELPKVVKRGDRVTVTARKGHLSITALGEARQPGILGETIRVRNSDSRKEILARIVAPGEVEVEF